MINHILASAILFAIGFFMIAVGLSMIGDSKEWKKVGQLLVSIGVLFSIPILFKLWVSAVL